MSDDAFKQCSECKAIRARLARVEEDRDMLLLAIESVFGGQLELETGERLLVAVARKVREGSR